MEGLKGLGDFNLCDEILEGCTHWEGKWFKVSSTVVVSKEGIKFVKAYLIIYISRNTFTN